MKITLADGLWNWRPVDIPASVIAPEIARRRNFEGVLLGVLLRMYPTADIETVAVSDTKPMWSDRIEVDPPEKLVEVRNKVRAIVQDLKELERSAINLDWRRTEFNVLRAIQKIDEQWKARGGKGFIQKKKSGGRPG